MKKWGFDLTHFTTPEAFQRVLLAAGMPVSQEPERGDIGEFIWAGMGIIIVTGNNPITGEYCKPAQRKPEPGYASYIGIEGDDFKVALAVQAIREEATCLGQESGDERSFI